MNKTILASIIAGGISGIAAKIIWKKIESIKAKEKETSEIVKSLEKKYNFLESSIDRKCTATTYKYGRVNLQRIVAILKL